MAPGSAVLSGMLSDRQVRLLRRKMAEGKTIAAAAAAATMSERSGHTWKQGLLPSETKEPRSWRTREDPLAAVWATEVVPLLERDKEGVLEGTTVLGELQRRHGDAYGPPQLRTLQRRIHQWRALHGPEKEVMFEQRHEAGREGAFDFTDATELRVTIAGQVFAHLLFQFVLTFSKWRWVGLAFSETFEALVRGLQGALWELGGTPHVWRSDNLQAATHQVGGRRELNLRYADVLGHYGVRSTRIEPGESHQNGVAEKAHDVLKSALDQALTLRGSRDFGTTAEYMGFVGAVRDRLNAGKPAALFSEERQHLKPLPRARVPEYTTYTAVVRQWSTIHFARRVYSVPSRLIGCEVEVRQHPDVVEVYYRDTTPTVTMPRLRGERYHQVDYRHVIWSLVRKPGAFARYRFREELFPALVFRRAYDALVDAYGERADVEYVRILHLAASTMQSDVEAALEGLLAAGQRPDFITVKGICAPEKPTVPEIHIPAPDPSEYDGLLSAGGGA